MNNIALYAFLLLFAVASCDDGHRAVDGGPDADSDTDADTDSDTDTDTDSDVPECPDGMAFVPGTNACIDSLEYTNGRFDQFLIENGNDCGEDVCRIMGEESFHLNEDSVSIQGEDFISLDGGVPELSEGLEEYPVGWVTWFGARDACTWEDKSLCPWDVFYQACSDGGSYYFPWGGEINGEPTLDGWVAAWEADICNDFGNADYKVGSFPLCEGSIEGLFDIVGNIGEWGGSRKLDGYWVYMGGSYNSFYIEDGTGSNNAGAGCVYPDYHGEENPGASSLDTATTPYWPKEDLGFRCCKFLE